MVSKKGVCVFDIDNTITSPQCNIASSSPEERAACNMKNVRSAHQMMDWCKQNGMELALNTARKRPSLSGVDESLQQRIAHEIKSSNFCHRKKGQSVVEAKGNCMRRIHENVDPTLPKESIVLIDDRRENCDFVRSMGFSSVHVEEGFGVADTHMYLLAVVLSRYTSMKAMVKADRS